MNFKILIRKYDKIFCYVVKSNEVKSYMKKSIVVIAVTVKKYMFFVEYFYVTFYIGIRKRKM